MIKDIKQIFITSELSRNIKKISEGKNMVDSLGNKYIFTFKTRKKDKTKIKAKRF